MKELLISICETTLVKRLQLSSNMGMIEGLVGLCKNMGWFQTAPDQIRDGLLFLDLQAVMPSARWCLVMAQAKV